MFDRLVKDETITGGMIPKLETAVSAINGGVKSVSILDGREKNCILKALSGDMMGTTVCH
jgi:acetylglutamate kinase